MPVTMYMNVRLENLVICTRELESYDNKGTRSHDYKGGILQVLQNKSHVITKEDYHSVQFLYTHAGG